MKKRQVVTVWIVVMLTVGVFFLNAVTCSDDNVEFSIIVPIFMSVPFVAIGVLLVYFFRDRKK